MFWGFLIISLIISYWYFSGLRLLKMNRAMAPGAHRSGQAHFLGIPSFLIASVLLGAKLGYVFSAALALIIAWRFFTFRRKTGDSGFPSDPSLEVHPSWSGITEQDLAALARMHNNQISGFLIDTIEQCDQILKRSNLLVDKSQQDLFQPHLHYVFVSQTLHVYERFMPSQTLAVLKSCLKEDLAGFYPLFDFDRLSKIDENSPSTNSLALVRQASTVLLSGFERADKSTIQASIDNLIIEMTLSYLSEINRMASNIRAAG